MSQHWLIVGAGRCGLQLARSMVAAGIPPRGVLTRDAVLGPRLAQVLPGVAIIGPGDDLPPGDGLLIAVPDDSIPACAAQLAGRGGGRFPVAAHTSGLRPAAVLAPLREVGCSLASLHPLVSFPDATGALVPLHGVTATIEGEEGARRDAAALATLLGMIPIVLRAEDKPLYHAAASLAGNLTYALVVSSRELLENIGFSKEAARAALAPLVRGSVEAALEANGWERLTGALPRADRGSVRVHMEALPAPIAAAYRALAAHVITRLTADGTLDNTAAAGLVAALTGTG